MSNFFNTLIGLAVLAVLALSLFFVIAFAKDGDWEAVVLFGTPLWVAFWTASPFILIGLLALICYPIEKYEEKKKRAKKYQY